MVVRNAAVQSGWAKPIVFRWHICQKGAKVFSRGPGKKKFQKTFIGNLWHGRTYTCRTLFKKKLEDIAVTMQPWNRAKNGNVQQSIHKVTVAQTSKTWFWHYGISEAAQNHYSRTRITEEDKTRKRYLFTCSSRLVYTPHNLSWHCGTLFLPSLLLPQAISTPTIPSPPFDHSPPGFILK